MNLKQIHNFIVICEMGSFAAASDILGVTQPSLSRQIQLLETELHQHLLIRNGRGVTPTASGLRFLDYSKRIHGLCNLAKQELLELSNFQHGVIKLGLPPRIARRIMLELVSIFRKLLPESKLVIDEALSNTLRDWMIKGKIDLALLYDPQPSELFTQKIIYREELVFAYSCNAKLLPPKVIRLSELSSYPMVLPSKKNNLRNLLDNACSQEKVTLNIVAEVGVMQSVVETIVAGNLYTIIPISELNGSTADSRLSYSRFKDTELFNNLCIAFPPDESDGRLVNLTAEIISSLNFSKLVGNV